jgi:hypothetical protein
VNDFYITKDFLAARIYRISIFSLGCSSGGLGGLMWLCLKREVNLFAGWAAAGSKI